MISKSLIGLMVVFSLLSGTNGLATIINVPDEQATIQEGINAASSGDTVLVAPGTYYENINFDARSITVMGVGEAYETIISPDNPSVFTVVMFSCTGDRTEFKNFTVTGGGATATVYLENCLNVNISHNIFHDNVPIGTPNTEVISVTNSTVTVTRNLFYGNGGIGCVGLREGSQNSWIINNTFDGNERGFFSIASGGYAINNLVTKSIERGVGSLEPGDFTLLDYNNVWNNNPNYDIDGVAGPNSISADPLYFDPGSHNYAIQAESPCIDAGHPDAQYNDPDGSRNDIGAYYYIDYNYPVAINIGYSDSYDNYHVSTYTPYIHWDYVDTGGSTQAEYELEVGSDNDWAAAELWDTGPVASSANGVAYAGDPLDNHTIYYLQIRVNNGTDWGDWTESVFRIQVPALINVPADYPDIQSAVEAAYNSDTILVEPGVYMENLDFLGKSLILVGDDARGAVILRPVNSATNTIVLDGCDFAGISGLTVTGGGATQTVLIVNCAQVELSGNLFYDNIPIGGYNIEVISVNNSTATVTRNLFYGNGGIGCVGLREGSESSWIVNNTFDGNERGFFSIASGGYAINNLVTNSIERGVGSLEPGNFSMLDYNNVWNNNPNYDIGGVAGPNSISGDPLYLDPASRNYAIQAESPCIDAGHPDEQYNDPDESRNDIGAFYYTPFNYPLALNISYGEFSDGNYIFSYTPTIQWEFTDTSGLTQTQFEIEVGNDDDWAVAELWDTGPVVSSENNIVYAGNPLINHTVYYMRIRVNNGIDWGDWTEHIFITQVPELIKVPADYPDIQSAIEAGFNGDTILVAPGTYVENLDFLSKTLILVGEESRGEVILMPADPSTSTIILNECDDVRIGGFTITGGGAVNTVFLQYSSQVEIDGNIFHDNIPVGSPNIEVISVNSSTAVVTRNLFYANGGIGCVGLRGGSHDSWIINNTFDSNERGFFSVASGGYAINNLITNSIERGVGSLEPGNFTLLDYNDVWNNNPDYDIGGVAGPNSISADPVYIDPDNYDYSLFIGSPCIDAGHPDPQYNDPDGSRNDIGFRPFGNIICGDVDESGAVNILDISYLIAFLYLGGPPPGSLIISDASGDGYINILDITYLIAYLYQGGPEPICI